MRLLVELYPTSFGAWMTCVGGLDVWCALYSERENELHRERRTRYAFVVAKISQ